MKVTWLTQAGLLLENSRIKIVADPYLTDSLGKLKPEKARRIPADESFFDASADVILLTHAHIDHPDTATLRRMLDGCKAPCLVLASPSAYEIVSELGGEHNYVLMAPHSVWSERGITFYAVNAEHSDRGAVGFIIDDGEKIPREGRLRFRGIDMEDIINGCITDDRFGFEEVVYLLLFGTLPTKEQLDEFCDILSACRELPDDFIEDMIMKAPSPDIMNKLSRSVLALYSYDENPDDTSVENVLRQCIHLIAQMPAIMVYAYQVKRRHYYRKSMYIHQPKRELCTAQSILRTWSSEGLSSGSSR